jgi:transitional endoplasmic reticulum ATPase
MSTTKKTKETNQEMNRKKELNRLIELKGVDEGIRYFTSKLQAEEQVVSVSYTLNCFSLEGAYALYKSVERISGHVDLAAQKGPSGNNPPRLVDVKLPDGTSVKIPWGKISLPEFDEDSYLETDYDSDNNVLHISGQVKKKFIPNINKIVSTAEKILATESIYKGQAINLEFEDDEYHVEPTFINLSHIDDNKILMSKEARDGILPILARIVNTKECLEMGLDLKYGALMEGPYGTGKTLTAFYIAKKAIENGWTFIYLKECLNMEKALRVAENYVKCGTGKGVVLFTEDIDQALRGNRDRAMQGILNTLDGGDTKGLPIISIFTTNHIEKIEPTFLRGKRIGGLISLGALDKETAKQFIENLVVDKDGKSLMDGGDHTEAIDSLVGIVPAFASEVIDKSKAYMIARGAKLISSEDIKIAADSYKKQMEFAKLKQHDESEEKLSAALQLISKQLVVPDEMITHLNTLFDRVGVNRIKR